MKKEKALQIISGAIGLCLTGCTLLTPEVITLPPQTPVSHPDALLSEEESWLVFEAKAEEEHFGPSHLWAINAHGTGLTELVNEPILSFKVSPKPSDDLGTTIAYITPTYTLKLLSLSNGEITTIASLLGDKRRLEDSWNLNTAIIYDGLKWSPDGNLLAFVGAMSGSSVDVYAYDLAGRSITRLSKKPSHAYDLDWSSDGRYLVYKGFHSAGMSGPGFSEMWAVKADGTGTLSLLRISNDLSGHWINTWWLGTAEIFYTINIASDGHHDRILKTDLETRKTTVVLKENFFYAAFAAKYNTWILTPSFLPKPEDSLILYKQGQRQEIPRQGIMSIQWFDDQDVFLGETGEGDLFTITPEGNITELSRGWDPAIPSLHNSLLISPDKETWISPVSMYSRLNLWLGKPMAEPVKFEFTLDHKRDATTNKANSVIDMTWTPDSQRLIVFADQGIYTIEMPDLELNKTMDIIWDGRLYSGDFVWIGSGDDN